MSKDNKIDLKNQYLEMGNVLENSFHGFGVSNADADNFSENLYLGLKNDDHEHIELVANHIIDYARTLKVLEAFKKNEKVLLEENRVEKIESEKEIVDLNKFKRKGAH
tara:strand:+ start:164 stop:487 length:324 start_codon:yes stop_codon:yes gene_type:complete